MIKKKKINFYNYKDKFQEVKNRVFFVIIALIIFRISSFIPIPGVDTDILSNLFEKQHGTIIEMFNIFSGGALGRASIFALGIMPYITVSIIIQILTVMNPTLSEIKKEGESGKRKINKYTSYGTLILAIVQSVGITTGLLNIPGMEDLVINLGIVFYLIAIVSLVCGTMFLVWLGQQITKRGIGNGISVIIFAGIISGIPNSIVNLIEQSRQGSLSVFSFLMIILLVFVITFFVVFIERGYRKIIVNYAKRQQGRKIYSAQSSYLPLKINMAGVIPPIFASSVILLPTTITSWFRNGINAENFNKITSYVQPGQFFYMFIYASLIIFFCFFYTALVFNPKETAENLKKSGAFLPGIRPGEQTAKHIDKIMSRITLIGSSYITLICLLPEFIRSTMNISFYFGGTSLLIVVVVIMDLITQIQTLMISSNQYESLLRNANLKR